MRAASVFRIPILSDLISFVTRDERERKDQFVRDNVSALARKLGEVQAQLLRLDAVGERVGKAAGSGRKNSASLSCRAVEVRWKATIR